MRTTNLWLPNTLSVCSRFVSSLVVFLLCLSASPLNAEEEMANPAPQPRARRADVVLIGATSSLAKKYLFQSFFRSYLEEELKPGGPARDFHFYGGATRPVEEGRQLLSDILAISTSCKCVQDVDLAVCEEKLSAFRKSFQYVQLRGEDHYKQLGRRLEREGAETGKPLEGRLFYLSISPDLYAGIAQYVGDYLRPIGARDVEAPWVRVVVEKPFGRDLASAEALAAALGQHLAEDELYRVDHYMGKGVVQAILPFRRANRGWLEALWTGRHVGAVEVSMKETEDCQGRTSFYEGYGVIRDVLQNHLTQVLVLLKMDIPPDKESTSSPSLGSHHHRTAVLRELVLGGETEGGESRASIHVGQYQGYLDHVASDRRSEPRVVRTSVPTAASVTLASRHPRWGGVSFTLKAGKALDERTSYARVVLCDGVPEGAAKAGCACELLFNIQGGKFGTAIAWNRTACTGMIEPAAVVTPPGWLSVENEGENGLAADWQVLRPTAGENAPNAYDMVVAAVLSGDRSMFLDTEELLHQWRVWDNVLSKADTMEPELYPKGFALDEVEMSGLIGSVSEENEDSPHIEL